MDLQIVLSVTFQAFDYDRKGNKIRKDGLEEFIRLHSNWDANIEQNERQDTPFYLHMSRRAPVCKWFDITNCFPKQTRVQLHYQTENSCNIIVTESDIDYTLMADEQNFFVYTPSTSDAELKTTICSDALEAFAQKYRLLMRLSEKQARKCGNKRSLRFQNTGGMFFYPPNVSLDEAIQKEYTLWGPYMQGIARTMDCKSIRLCSLRQKDPLHYWKTAEILASAQKAFEDTFSQFVWRYKRDSTMECVTDPSYDVPHAFIIKGHRPIMVEFDADEICVRINIAYTHQDQTELSTQLDAFYAINEILS